MTSRNSKDTARAYFERLINSGDLASASELFAVDCRFHYPLGELAGIAAVKEYIGAVRAGFPDIHFDVKDLFGEGDLVACRWNLAGTQTGDFRGKPGTGKRVSVPGNTIFHVASGKIKEMWVAFDPALLI